MKWCRFTVNSCLYSEWDVKLKVFIVVVKSDWHVTFGRESDRTLSDDCGLSLWVSLLLCLCDRQRRQVIKEDNASGPELNSGRQGQTQRHSVIGGRSQSWSRWVKLFMSPPAKNPHPTVHTQTHTVWLSESASKTSPEEKNYLGCILYLVCLHSHSLVLAELLPSFSHVRLSEIIWPNLQIILDMFSLLLFWTEWFSLSEACIALKSMLTADILNDWQMIRADNLPGEVAHRGLVSVA